MQRIVGAVVAESASDGLDLTLGLYDPADRTPPQRPRAVGAGRAFVDPASFRIVAAIDELAEQQRDTVLRLTDVRGTTEVPLGELRHLVSPFRWPQADPADPGDRMVLRDIFRPWWDARPEDCRTGTDALDALRALVVAQVVGGSDQVAHGPRAAEVGAMLRVMIGEERLELRYPVVVQHVLEWVLAGCADAATLDECLDGAEAVLASVPEDWFGDLLRPEDPWRYRTDWRRDLDDLCPWMWITDGLLQREPSLFTAERLAQWFGLRHWMARPIPGAALRDPESRLLYAAHAAGIATDADVFENLIGDHGFFVLFTQRRRADLVQRHPTVAVVADRIRARVLELEMARGDAPGPATPLAFRLGSIEGAEVALTLLAGLGSTALTRRDAWMSDDRKDAYSRLIRVSYPSRADTPETVRAQAADRGLGERRLVELAVFAPQWAPLVEAALGWDGLDDAVWWFHAHTKDERWSVPAEVRREWTAASAERTPLSAEDLTDGAVDVAWFTRAHGRLGAKRWAVLHQVAKLASGGNGHRRAQTFSDAMLGRSTEEDLVTRIRAKRHQDSVRALGLLPLPDADRPGAALRRYQVLREFERGANAFGPQRRQSELTAARIGVDNLARNSGLQDPQRFIWTMEVAEAGELADGPVAVTVEDVTVSLVVNDDGEA